MGAAEAPEPAAKKQQPDGSPHQSNSAERYWQRISTEISNISLFELLEWLRKRIKIILLCTLVFVLAAFVFAKVTPPRYTAYTDIFIDPVDLQVVGEDLVPQSPMQAAQLLAVESKMRYLNSSSVLRRVVKTLDLVNDREFVKPPNRLTSLLSASAQPATEDDREVAAMRELYKRVEVQREELSFVVTLSVWARTPEKSVVLSNAIVDGFKAELVAADAERAGRAVDSLGQRLDELRANVTEAESAVEDFRAASGLQSSSGELVSTQTMGQLNTQLVAAQSRLIEAEARFDELTAMISNGSTNGATPDAVDSEVLTELRSQYAETRQEIDSQSANYGPRHPAIAQLEPQLRGIQQEIDTEVRRLIQAADRDREEAQSVVDRLKSEIDRVRGTVSNDNASEIKLRELERDAAAEAAIYEAYLVRAGQVAQREQIDSTNIRVMSPAVPPEARSYPPRTPLLMIIGAIGGLAVGVMLAALLGFRNRLRAGAKA